MIRFLTLFGRKPVVLHPRQRRAAALAKLNKARAHHDKRGEGEALAALRAATHDLMRVELRLVS